MKNIGIIGAGLQAKRRLPAILEDSDYRVIRIIDRKVKKAQQLAKLCGALSSTKWKEAINDKSIDIVLVLTYPDTHSEISIAAMKAGKDVLCEKPLARTLDEASDMVKTANQTKRILKCGFNHRYHPAVSAAHKYFTENKIGKLIFGRGRYGISGRANLEKEWRSDPKIVAGGQLMEQGIHLVDLASWFFGEIKEVTGFVNTAYWPIKPLEDNAFALLKNENGAIVSIHSSLTQWINLFNFELYGEKGAIEISGLGDSYGTEKLVITTKSKGPFTQKIFEYRGGDVSWHNEWKDFSRAIKTRKKPMTDGLDGYMAMKIVSSIYNSSKTGQAIRIGGKRV